MKPTTKNCEGAKKKELNTTSKIQKYFKTVPKRSQKLIENENEREATRAVYINALKQKLEKFANEGDAEIQRSDVIEEEVGASAVAKEEDVGTCSVATDYEDPNKVLQKSTECDECMEKSIEIQELRTKYKDLKNVYAKISIRYAELDMKYSDLLKTRTRTNYEDIDDDLAVGTSSCDVFSPSEIKVLQGMSLEKKKDSSFILQCLEYAYKGDLSVLCNKTLKGKLEMVQISELGEVEFLPKKDPLTPKKVERIRELFIERIAKCRIDPVVYEERIKNSNINKLFASSITNITKKLK